MRLPIILCLIAAYAMMAASSPVLPDEIVAEAPADEDGAVLMDMQTKASDDQGIAVERSRLRAFASRKGTKSATQGRATANNRANKGWSGPMKKLRERFSGSKTTDHDDGDSDSDEEVEDSGDDAEQGSGRKIKNFDEDGVKKLKKCMRHAINRHIAEHCDNIPGVHSIKIPEGGLQVQEAQGEMYHASVTAVKDGSPEESFGFEIRKELNPGPSDQPSAFAKGIGSDDPCKEYEIDELTPDPCHATTSFTTKVYPEFARMSDEEFIATKTGYLPAEEPNFLEDTTVLTQAEIEDLDEDFDWTKQVNCEAWKVESQQTCGDCWAWGATRALSGRFCVQSNGTADIVLSPQATTSCASGTGCNGGTAHGAYASMNPKKPPMQSKKPIFGTVVDSCQPFLAKQTADRVDGAYCNDKVIDENCPDAKRYFVRKLGVSSGLGIDTFTKTFKSRNQIKKELKKNGPMFCSLMVYSDFSSYKGGIYKHESGSKKASHALSLVGWGRDDSGEEYWRLQNSWGDKWGEEGYVRVSMNNQANSEFSDVHRSAGCISAMPDLTHLCPNSCDHGVMDNDCKCTCEPGWTGADCNTCDISCDGEEFAGGRVEGQCRCQCKAEFHGKNCAMQIKLPSEAVSGVPFTVAFELGSGASSEIADGDLISVFPEDSSIWTPENGWDQASEESLDLTDEVEDERHWTLYKAGTYKVVWIKLKNKYTLEYDTDFHELGTIKVSCPEDGDCINAPSPCKDEDYPNKIGSCFRRAQNGHCGRGISLNENEIKDTDDTATSNVKLDAACAKSCRCCQHTKCRGPPQADIKGDPLERFFKKRNQTKKKKDKKGGKKSNKKSSKNSRKSRRSRRSRRKRRKMSKEAAKRLRKLFRRRL